MKTNDEIYEAVLGIRGDFQTHCATDTLHFDNIYKQLARLDISMRAGDTALFEARGKQKFISTLGTLFLAAIPTGVYATVQWLFGHHK